MKQCVMCKQIKNESEFNPLKRMKDGLNVYCKKCQKQYNKEYRERNKQRLKERRQTPEYKEKRKNCRAKHKEEIKIYNKKYHETHKEMIKTRYKDYRIKYWEEHKDEANEKARIRNREKKHCFVMLEEIQNIENYNQAQKDNFRKWQRHHRLETRNSDGEIRLVQITPAELKALDMYYNRPASELIYLKVSEHTKEHSRCKK